MKRLVLFVVMMAVVSVHAGMLEDNGVHGGLAVVVGCDDVKLINELGKNDKFLVQALDADAAKVKKAQGELKNYGRVSADVFDGQSLPYADNLVNAVVITGYKSKVSKEEVLRVLAPRGIAFQKSDGKPAVIMVKKQVPADTDEWTHYLYDAKNNAVSHDEQVATPKSLQWDSGPRWSTHHDHMSSISASVTTGGRIFTILDEGSRSSVQLPADWKVVAQDAYNGKLLWKRSIPDWHSRLWPAKAGPSQLPRRLVAIGDKVYVTLGLHAPVTMLDAVTGKTLKTFKGSEHTEEIVVDGNQLILMAHASEPPEGKWKLEGVRCWGESNRANGSRPWAWSKEDPRKVILIDITSGEVVWTKDAPIAPVTLGADKNNVVYHDGENVVCLDRKTGKQKWVSEYKAKAQAAVRAAPNLVIYGEVALFSRGPGEVASISMKDGSTLWKDFHGPSGHMSTYDLLVADGLIWSTAMKAKKPRQPKKKKGAKKAPAPEPKSLPFWTFVGRDPVTGEEKKVFPPGKSDWFHHRCHRGRATDNYLIMARTGIEYIDLNTGKWQPNPWVRGACLYGYMPANGLTYAPPHPCGCYIESKLTGLNALTGESKQGPKKAAVRLEKGPAYGEAKRSKLSSEDWPTYRSDNKRSGSSSTKVASKVKEDWKANLGGKLSPATIAGGKVFVAAVDRHKVYALDADNGKVVWEYTAGGRVDTPPTIYQSLAIFGCKDGWVYCLRASDGELVWRYKAAPGERRIVSYDQLESTWPVNGAVLVQGGSVYGVAGRSMFLDGGLYIFKLDAFTGEKQFEEIMDDKVPGTGAPLDTTAGGLDMPVALPDILSSDGKNLYMRSQIIGMNGKRKGVETTRAEDQGGEDAHLICSSGYTDDSWFHRAYWVFGRGYGTGHNGWFRAGRFAPAGRIMSFNDDTVFAFGRLPKMYVWTSVLEYQIYSAEKEIKQEAIDRVYAASSKHSRELGNQGATMDRHVYGKFPLEDISANRFNWRNMEPSLQVRAMTLADKNLFIAGPKDVVNEEDIFDNPFDKDVQAKANEQWAAFEGKKGGVLQVVSTSDGSKLSEIELEATPVFDGLAAAGGKLYMSTTDGKVVCFK